VPVYDYKCTNCGKVEEYFAGYEERIQTCKCGSQMIRLIASTFGISIGVPAGGYFDENLGTYIHSNRHKRQVMQEQGVSERYGKGWV
jgi:putative FmdB family regulatory protein